MMYLDTKTLKKFSVNVVNTLKPCAKDKEPSKYDILIDQLLNSAIVGGIAWISQIATTHNIGSGEGFLVGFGLTFLIKLRDYRGIK